jgi:4-amino-4-deoxy-L-arabinose transferase-like glycosyltransferase
MPPSVRRWLIVVVLAGAALRVFPLWFGLPYPQARPDEETALSLALQASRGDLNPRFFHWPSLTIYVFAAVLGVARLAHGLLARGGELDFAGHVLLARLVVALAGTATVYVLFHLASRAAGARTALLASAFLAVAILHVRESHFAMTDVLTTMLVAASLAHLMRVVMAPVRSVPADAVRWCAIAGLSAGLAASTKYSAAALAASMLAAQALWFIRVPRLALSGGAWLPSIAYGAAMIAGFLVATPYAGLDHLKFSRDVAFNFTHLSGGHQGVMLGHGWVYHATTSLPYGVGVPVYLAALAGLVPFARHHARAATVLGAFAVSFYLVVGNGYTVFFRYMLPLVPLVCLSAAIGVSHAASWLAPRLRVREGVALAVLVAVTAGPALVYSAWFDLLLARTDTRVLAGRWLEERIRPGESLYDAGDDYARLDMWRAAFDSWDYDEASGSFTGGDGGEPDWLVLHESPLSAYTRTPPALRQLAASTYALVHEVPGTRGRARSAMYDRQDAFFLPVSGFSTVVRPGPTVRIYRRRGLPAFDGSR